MSPARSSRSGTHPTPASSPASSTCVTGTSSSRVALTAPPPPPAFPVYSPLAMWPITCIVRPSPPPDPAAWLRSMRTNISTSITAIDSAAWDALDAGGSPFLRHAFLSSLESTGCVGASTGWQPAPVTLYDEQGLAAAAPAYVKAHSYGEFVFDFSWAQAYAKYGLDYYPKLVLGVPFTPVSGERLLVRPDLDPAATRAAFITATREFAESRGLSSIHGLFVSEADRAALDAAGWLPRRDVQFHWINHGYRDFDHYLESFTAEKRKKTRRERRRVFEDGIQFDTLHGSELT